MTNESYHCQTPSKAFLQVEDGMRSRFSFCLTWVQAQDRSQQEDKQSLHFGVASLVLSMGCFVVGQFIYCGRQRLGMPRRLPAEGTWERLLTGPRKGLVCGGDICIKCLSYLTVTLGDTSGSSPPLRPCFSSYPSAECSHKWKKTQILQNNSGFMSAQDERGCGCTLWTRLSTPIAVLSGAIVVKSRTKYSFIKHLQMFITMCACPCDTHGMW